MWLSEEKKIFTKKKVPIAKCFTGWDLCNYSNSETRRGPEELSGENFLFKVWWYVWILLPADEKKDSWKIYFRENFFFVVSNLVLVAVDFRYRNVCSTWAHN